MAGHEPVELVRPRIPREMAGELAPEVAAALAAGVPRAVFDLYTAVAEVGWIVAPPAPRMVEFASSDSTESLCVDPAGGIVAELRLARPERSRHRDRPPIPPVFVNSSLPLLIESLARMHALLPAYRAADDEERWEAIADELERRIAEVDPPAVDPDAYWGSVIGDVSNGYFFAG